MSDEKILGATPQRSEKPEPVASYQLSRAERDRRFAEDCMRRDKARRELYFALRSRVLTDAEMAEVVAFDYWITLPIVAGWGPSYSEGEQRREFNDALLQQFKLRVAAQQVGSATDASKAERADSTRRSASAEEGHS